MNFQEHLQHLKRLPGYGLPIGAIPMRVPTLDAAHAEIAKVEGMMDAAFPLFLARELEQLEAKVLRIQYGELMYDKAFQVTNDINPGAQTVTYRALDGRGKVVPMGSHGKDLARVSASVSPDSYPVTGFVNSFGYTYQEMLAAQMAGMGLDQELANVARRAHEERLNELAWIGDATLGMKGFKNSGIPVVSAPAGVGGATWALKTALEIKDDIMTLMTKPYVDTNKKEKPDTLGVSPANYALLLSRTLPNTNQTLIKFILEQVPMLKSIDDIIDVPEFTSSIGAGGVQVAASWTRKNVDKVVFRNAEVVKFHPVQQIGLDWETPISTITGGLHFKYPKSALIMEGV